MIKRIMQIKENTGTTDCLTAIFMNEIIYSNDQDVSLPDV